MPRASQPALRQHKGRPFRDALRLEIAAAQHEDNPRSLRRIARRLLLMASQGEMAAIKELADRLDGKAVQPIAADDEDPIIYELIKRVIVKPDPGGKAKASPKSS